VASLLDQKEDGKNVEGAAKGLGITTGLTPTDLGDNSLPSLRPRALGSQSGYIPGQPSDEGWYHANSNEADSYVPVLGMEEAQSVTNPIAPERAAHDASSHAQDFVKAVCYAMLRVAEWRCPTVTSQSALR
jgi:hypothetical protein